MWEIAQNLTDTPLVLICGRNESVARRLRFAARSRVAAGKATHIIEGFTGQVPYYMAICDFFVGKAGPGSVSEAVAMGLPVIIERNAWTLPQERYNADWVREKEVGVVLRSFREVRGGVEEVLTSLDRFRANASRLNNRAIYEIPQILERVLARGDRPQAALEARHQKYVATEKSTPA
jgi:1,2-diacylglycerol 3-beta-galactosyltransferase